MNINANMHICMRIYIHIYIYKQTNICAQSGTL